MMHGKYVLPGLAAMGIACVVAGLQAEVANMTASNATSAINATSATQPAHNAAPCCKRAASRPAVASTMPAASRPALATTRPSGPTVTLFYFHRTLRCPTCMKLEELAKKAIDTGFKNEMRLGTLKWKAVNVEDKGNEHFIKDYKLEGPSLVLVKSKHDKQLEWQNMEKVWELVGSPDDYAKYVQTHIRDYLRDKKTTK